MNKILIEKEHTNDYTQIHNLIESAFKNAEHTDGNEHFLVDKLRTSPSYINDLSLVAQYDNKIIGHIMLTKGKIGETTALALAPLSVSNEYQKQGVGSKLIITAHKIAKSMGFKFITVLGDPNYYSKFGYVTALDFNITAPFDVPAEFFMVKNLHEDNNYEASGTFTYAKEFFE